MAALSNPFDDNEVATATHQGARKAPPAGGFELRVETGPDRDALLTIDISTPGRAIIGHGPASSLRLTDREVSRRHLAVEMSGPYLKVTDLESTNGTRINGLRIVDVELSGGERIQVGQTTICVQRREAHQPSSIPVDTRFGRLVGASLAMRALHSALYRLADADVPILLEGETGTGKELLAETLHEFGLREHGPFVVVDCTGLPTRALETTLFGEEGGDAGGFEQATGGSLLVDEVANLDLPLQTRLLRAIDRREIRRNGGARPVAVDVRLIVTTRHDLDAEVQAGRFREDLYFRLAGGRVELPPLRKREGDVALLAAHFWTAFGGEGATPEKLLARYANYKWPGNVRELRNVIAREVSFAPGEVLPASRGTSQWAVAGPEPSHVTSSSCVARDVIDAVIGESLALPRARQKVVEEFERRYVEHVLAQHRGHVSRAAAASGIALRYFQAIRARQKQARLPTVDGGEAGVRALAPEADR